MNRSWKLLVFATLITLTSCFKDEYNFNDVSMDNYNPSFAAPLLEATVNLGQVMENVDTTQIKADANNLLKITYSDTLMSYNVAELISIPTQSISESFTLPAFSIGNLNNSSSVELRDLANGLEEPDKTIILASDGANAPFPAMPAQALGNYGMRTFTEFNTVVLSQGTLTIEITNNWPFPINNLTMDIINVGDGSVIGTYSYPSIAMGATESAAVDLTDVTMTNNLQAIISNIDPGTSGAPVLIDLSSTLDVTSTASNLEVSSGTAIFPSQDAINETVDVDLTLDNGEELNSVQLNSGSIDYSIDYGLRENAQITISLPYITNQGTPITEVINVTSDHINSKTVTGSIDLSNNTIDLTANGARTNYIEASVSASIISSGQIIPFSITDAVTANLDIANLDIAFIDGYLGNLTESIPADTIVLDLFNNEFSELISVAAPELSMKLNNSAGIPIEADMSQIFAYNDQTSLQLTGIANPLTINSPNYSEIGESKVTTISLNRESSNIVDVFDLNPSGIAYQMFIETNPAGNTGDMNFINSDSKIDVTMDVDIPMYGSVSGFSIEDTLDFALDSINILQSATLRAIIENEFPVDVDVQLYFVDENFAVIDSLFSNGERLVQSSTIDANGDLVSATTSENDIVVSEDKLNNLMNASKIILHASLETANGGTQDAKFYTHYEMNINLGIIATIQINQ